MLPLELELEVYFLHWLSCLREMHQELTFRVASAAAWPDTTVPVFALTANRLPYRRLNFFVWRFSLDSSVHAVEQWLSKLLHTPDPSSSMQQFLDWNLRWNAGVNTRILLHFCVQHTRAERARQGFCNLDSGLK